MSAVTPFQDGLVNLNSTPLTGYLGSLGGQQAIIPDVALPPEIYHQLYSVDAFAAQTVDTPADDATSEWRVWSDLEEGPATQLRRRERELRLEDYAHEALQTCRLYGGSAIIIATRPDTESLAKPITRGARNIVSLSVATRFELKPVDPNRRVNDTRHPNNGLPEFWDYTPVDGRSAIRVHHTHIAFFRQPTPKTPRGTVRSEWWWGDGVLRRMYDMLTHAQQIRDATAGLVEIANIDTLKTQGLTETLRTQHGEAEVKRYASALKAGRKVNGLNIIDGNDDLVRSTLTFAGLKDLSEFAHALLAAGADIPITRFLGRSPGGLNSTGESDLVNYALAVKKIQKKVLQKGLLVIDQMLARSIGLSQVPEQIWLLPNLEPESVQVDRDDKRADTLNKLVKTGAVPPVVTETIARESLTQQFSIVGGQTAYEAYDNEQGELDLTEPEPEPDE